MVNTSSKFVQWIKRSIILSNDIFVTMIAWLIASWLCTNFFVSSFELESYIMVGALQSSLFLACGLYRGIWRFASIPDLFRILRAVLLGSVAIMSFFYLRGVDLPIQIYIAYSALNIILLCAPRLLYRWYRDYRKQSSQHLKKVLIVGAGCAGEGIIRDLQRSPLNKNYLAIALVDDDESRCGYEVHGVRILGNCEDIPNLVKKHKIDLILIAIPSASSNRMRKIVNYCEQSGAIFRTLPGIKDIADGTVSMNSLREVLLEDLLGREQVTLDWEAIRHSLVNKTVLVTGGGGSIGSELCRQIIKLSPKQLIIIDKNEFNLYAIDKELQDLSHTTQIESHLCCTTDKIETSKLFQAYKPNIVFHVAAYKHVPLLEKHLRIAMQNNIIGTRVMADLAHQYQAEKFVLISTDKAVNPTNIMGATKRASEVFCQNFNLHSATKFITVRFGNVLNSSGSVIPLFRKQLLEGGPLTVTHPEISRYFMTIPEASLLILQATTMCEEGEIFVLDMGNPVKIRYLAEQIIKLSGKTIGRDIDITYIGLRPGEKLHEELFHYNENVEKTSHSQIRRAKIRVFDWDKLLNMMNEMEVACNNYDEDRLKILLCQLVPEYTARSEKIVTEQQPSEVYTEATASLPS